MKRLSFILALLLGLGSATTVLAQDKMDFKDSDGNLLMQVNDEGDAGSITLPGLGAVPSVFTDKIYSIGGELYFNGQKLSTPWSMSGANVFYNSGNVGVGTDSPNSNAVLDIDAAGNDKGVLLPRLTTAQRTAISGLAASEEGLIVYDETTDSFWFWSGSQWNELGAGSGGGNGWSLTGNAGAVDGANFIGTTDDVPLEFRVNNERVMRISTKDIGSDEDPHVNIVAGHSANSIASNIYGSTISGGGRVDGPNTVTGNFATIGGGLGNTEQGAEGSTIGGGRDNTITHSTTGPTYHATIGGGSFNIVTGPAGTVAGGTQNRVSGVVAAYATVGGGRDNTASGVSATVSGGGGFDAGVLQGNTASGDYSTVPGGAKNSAGGDYSFAAGRRAIIDGSHNGAFLFSDRNNKDFNSAAANEFAARATGGVRFVTAIDGSGNPTQTVSIDNTGTVTAGAFVGDGSGLTGISGSGDNLGDHTATQTLDLNSNDITNGGTVTATAFVGNGSGLTGISGDNLGNHTVTQNIDLNGNWLTNDANFDNGIFVNTNGNVGIGSSDPQAKLEIRPGGDGDPGSNPAEITGLKVDLSSFSGDKTSALFLGGNVGIGTPDPLAPLHVNGTTSIASFSGGNSGGAWMKVSSGAGSDEIDWAENAGSTPVSIYANGSIVADGEGVFVAATVNWSDERIKNVEGVSDTKQDLETVDGIEITDYRRIDGGKREKKVIAQQLRKVFPQAVSLREGVIPSIYAHIEHFEFDEAMGVLTIETPTPHELAVGDQVDYYTEAGKLSKQPVAAILSDHVFQVEASSEPQELFVFGKWVSDVHVVDYDAISMLNVSATQELHRIIEAQEQRIAELEAQNGTLTSQNSAFEERFAQIEMAVQQMSDVELTSAENE